MDGNLPKAVKVQPIPSRSVEQINKRELWATICYYYPQYTLKEASELSIRDIKLLLRVAEKKEAEARYDYTQIVAAPHTKKGAGVKQLTDYYRDRMKR